MTTISNPLASFAGCAEALASLAAKGERRSAREARQFRDLVRTEVARCERIVRFLLDSSRSTPGDGADLEATVSLALRLLERHPAPRASAWAASRRGSRRRGSTPTR